MFKHFNQMQRNREYLQAFGNHDAVFIGSNDEFDDAIIGISTDSNVIYSYDLILDCIKRNYGDDEEDALSYLEYNILSSINNMPEPRPIIIHEI